MTTKRQKLAVKFVEEVLDIPFKGNLNDFEEVHYFLSWYLDDAKTESKRHIQEEERRRKEIFNSYEDDDDYDYMNEDVMSCYDLDIILGH